MDEVGPSEFNVWRCFGLLADRSDSFLSKDASATLSKILKEMFIESLQTFVLCKQGANILHHLAAKLQCANKNITLLA